MTERMYRTQVLLYPQQRIRLEEIARCEGKSISAVIRQVIDAGLEQMGNEAEVWKKRAIILSTLKAQRGQQPVEYTEDLINQIRKEREDERDQVWGSSL